MDREKIFFTNIHKQFICSTLNYASPAWSSILSKANKKSLKTTKNRAPKIITRCLAVTNIKFLLNETKMFPTQSHFNTLGTWFFTNLNHSITNHQSQVEIKYSYITLQQPIVTDSHSPTNTSEKRYSKQNYSKGMQIVIKSYPK